MHVYSYWPYLKSDNCQIKYLAVCFVEELKKLLESAILATITKTLNCVKKTSSGVGPDTQYLMSVKLLWFYPVLLCR
jgi:hypothetical protein